MKSEVLKLFPWIDLTCLGLILFFVFFVNVIFWVLRKDRSSIYSYIEKLPYSEDTYEQR